MISVENFYWVLHQNLLSPTQIDSWYHYPFGTTKNLSKLEFPALAETQSHVLYHYDQEPIWPGQFSEQYVGSNAWSNKTIRILANSEHSDHKKRICRERNMLDWYFFYHGFAALDWFRDAQHLGADDVVSQPFLLLNHLVRDHRAYRMALLARLIRQDVAHRGIVSFHGTFRDCEAELDSVHSFLSHQDKQMIFEYAPQLRTLPWIVDSISPNGNLSAQFGHRELSLWQRALVHVVTETVFYEPKLHLTEKIFKPIVSARPFVLVAAPGNLAYLRSYGFETFSPWIDESYDLVEDNDKRLDMIAHEIYRISNLPVQALQDIKQQMIPILEHNKRHFFGRFRSLLVNELVDNFDRCVRAWNSSRVDGAQKPVLSDLNLIKKTLLG